MDSNANVGPSHPRCRTKKAGISQRNGQADADVTAGVPGSSAVPVVGQATRKSGCEKLEENRDADGGDANRSGADVDNGKRSEQEEQEAGK
jgi:hypothetical protein